MFTDADLAYGPDQVRRVLAAVESGWDVAIGDRRHPEARMLVAVPAAGLGQPGDQLAQLPVLLGSFRDTQSGLKGFRSDVARFLFSRTRVDGFAFDIEVLHLVERFDLSLTEVPVEVANPPRSTVSAIRDAPARRRHVPHPALAAAGEYEADGDLPPVLAGSAPTAGG